MVVNACFRITYIVISALILLVGCSELDATGPDDSLNGKETDGIAYYVAPGGNDSNPGTLALPWETIDHAAQTLVAGDTVFIREGTYFEYVHPANSGNTSSGSIVYMAYPGEVPVIDGSGVTIPGNWNGLLSIAGKSYIVVDGLHIENAGTMNNHSGIRVDTSSDIVIRNCRTYDTMSSGIGVWESDEIVIDGNEVILASNGGTQECLTVATTNNFTICNNIVRDGGTDPAGGEGIDAKRGSNYGEIYGNVVYNVEAVGIYVDAMAYDTGNIDVYCNEVYNTNASAFAISAEEGGLLHDVYFYNNIGYDCYFTGLTISDWGGSSTHPMNNITVINNTFYGNGTGNGFGPGIQLHNFDADNVTIRNNITSQNGYTQIYLQEYGTGLVVDYNLFYGDGTACGSNYIEANPEFVNPTGGNFHLQSDSPAIDEGSASLAPSFDFDGNIRPIGLGYEMGADEYDDGTGIN